MDLNRFATYDELRRESRVVGVTQTTQARPESTVAVDGLPDNARDFFGRVNRAVERYAERVRLGQIEDSPANWEPPPPLPPGRVIGRVPTPARPSDTVVAGWSRNGVNHYIGGSGHPDDTPVYGRGIGEPNAPHFLINPAITSERTRELLDTMEARAMSRAAPSEPLDTAVGHTRTTRGVGNDVLAVDGLPDYVRDYDFATMALSHHATANTGFAELRQGTYAPVAPGSVREVYHGDEDDFSTVTLADAVANVGFAEASRRFHVAFGRSPVGEAVPVDIGAGSVELDDRGANSHVVAGSTTFYRAPFNGAGAVQLSRGPTAAVTIVTPSAADAQPTAESQQVCCICMDNARRCVAYPCGHYSFCFGCAKTLYHGKPKGAVKCQLCKTLVQDVIKVYE